MNQVLQQVLPRLKSLYNALTKKEVRRGHHHSADVNTPPSCVILATDVHISQKLGLPDSAKSSAASDSDRQRGEEADYWETRIAAELERPAVDLEDDYLEMALQVSACPAKQVNALPLFLPWLCWVDIIPDYGHQLSRLMLIFSFRTR
jgi:hypothetical protein